MLSEQSQNLLSAFVDGVLTRQEREAVERLLRESSEARALLRTLQENVHRLKKLPRRTLGQDFSARVVSAMPRIPAEAGSFVDLVQKPRLRRGLPSWAVGGVSACFVAAGLGGLLWWMRGHVDFDRNLLPNTPLEMSVVKIKQPAKTKSPSEEPANPLEQLVAQVVRGTFERYGEPPVVQVTPKPPQPTRFTFADLQRENSFDYLKWELTQNDAVHLDVNVKYNVRSLNRVIESFSKQGIKLIVSPPAHASLAKNEPLLVYAENVLADKLALALKELGEADLQGKTKLASTFDALRVSTGSPDDQRRVSRVLGIEQRLLKTPAPAKAAPSSQGMIFAPLTPDNPATNREIQGFLSTRGPLQPGTLQVFVNLLPN